MARLFLARLLPCRPPNHARGPWRAPALTRRRQRVRRPPASSLAGADGQAASTASGQRVCTQRGHESTTACIPVVQACLAPSLHSRRLRSLAPGRQHCRWSVLVRGHGRMQSVVRSVSHATTTNYLRRHGGVRFTRLHPRMPEHRHARLKQRYLHACACLPYRPLKIHARRVRSSRRCPMLRCSTRY